ncbi:putative transcription factor interactor and regulator AUX-IAA family [Helianthus annuus]|uniref:Auxin-responsive protein n=1 Tax=Helianthus annuus TaxID=4232 RepID=A0A251TMP3_HELAN|nr:auxin-responsive protein IAA28 [Helianthus annuus]KAF5759798.1 putative transcription factor interactor and regulator AUX-IAA family [Helianthus annuus]KAJ0437942.1 putative transcription factor interactor and regulator AUX-IAA family [Helianthus annuus]KAJ0460264.1 putative transcription factor interactor and regulator AUX-IAA family [Helianthus annuus]KAJ0640702.1 putative transcription factor interactor and regulator AUX-IAA family [Helianthus annuus]KAJ0644625.1 putative transcription f
MELELSLSPPNQTRHPIKKTFNGGCSVTRFPLVSWNHKEDDDEQSNGFYTGDYQQDHLDEDEEGLTGWPPLHSWRRRLMEENHYERVDQFNRRVDEEGEHMNVMNNNNYNELFVKVKMEGVGIARKIDLNAFHSFEMLTTALIHMFNKSVEIEEGVSYKLMYQHRDGHWHLGGDLPWEMFVRSVKRIQMVRN